MVLRRENSLVRSAEGSSGVREASQELVDENARSEVQIDELAELINGSGGAKLGFGILAI